MSIVQLNSTSVVVNSDMATDTVTVKDNTSNIVSFSLPYNLVVNTVNNNVVSDVTKTDTVHTSAGIAGPKGDSAEDLDMYSKRVDFVSEFLIYKGEASPGSSEGSAVWRLRRIDLANDGDVTETWADGNTLFDNIWSDRLIKVYS
jgi:hypothetical protein